MRLWGHSQSNRHTGHSLINLPLTRCHPAHPPMYKPLGQPLPLSPVPRASQLVLQFPTPSGFILSTNC